jgi:thiamine biosynthesis lipoprotein
MPLDARTAVITSGSYRDYLEADDRFFGHIIDPRSGWAVEHLLTSVTVVGEDAAAAAAWGTALLCLGPRDASVTAEREDLAVLFWIQAEGGAPMLTQSSAFRARWAGFLDAPPTN